jgi:4-amino-4-deoxy-L-arabinose transferase-like glycosyltransferase/SAM-dependent methyltransferase
MNYQLQPEKDDLLWRQLKTVPAFRALLRAVESRFYRQLQQQGLIQEPLLDLGCGDGHFAQMTFYAPLTVGIDPWPGPLRKAQRAGAHRLVIHGWGDRMPFPDNYFKTVISNSVLEHIPDVQAVLNEAGRLLQPEGTLIITMPSHYFTQFLGGADFLAGLGLTGLAERYRTMFNAVSRHAHTDPPEQWATRLAQAGFRVERWQYYFSQGALKALEWGHLQGLPSAVIHAFTGQWIIAPWRDSLRPTEQWVRPFYEEAFPDAGAYVLFIARKQADHPITPYLPPARPLPVSLAEIEPEAESPKPPPVVPVEALTAPPEAETAKATAVPSGPPIAPIVLTGAGLLAALLGQLSLQSGGEWQTAVTWFALALAALWGGARAYRRPLNLNWLNQGTAVRRIAPLAGAFFLTWLAYRFGDGGRPLLALTLWGAGIAASLYAVWPRREIKDFADYADFSSAKSLIKLSTIPLSLFTGALLVRLVGLSQHPFVMTGTEANVGLDVMRILRGEMGNPFGTAWLTNPNLPLFLMAGPLSGFGPSVLGVRLLSPLVGALTVLAVYLGGRKLWGEDVGLAAAILLLGSPWHLQYSRLGMVQIWDGLLLATAVCLLALAWRRGQRMAWIAAGLAVGLGGYFFAPARLLPLLLLGGAGWLWATAAWRKQGRHIVAGAAVALVTALPVLLYYNNNPNLYLDRFRAQMIFQADWLAGQDIITGLEERLGAAIFAFNAGLDGTSAYNPGVPLVSLLPGLFMMVGLGLALWRGRQLAYGLLLLWVGLTAVLGGALLIEPVNSYRLLAAAPAVYLLAAMGLVWTGRQLFRQLDLPVTYWRPILLGVVAVAAVGDMGFYFGSYRQQPTRFADRNTEAAHRMADFLNDLEGEWTVYLHTPPSLYADFPTLPFLAPQFSPNLNLFNVPPDLNEPIPTAPTTAVAFIFLPERSADLNQITGRYPGGWLEQIRGRHADPLFLVYRVAGVAVP